MVAVVKTHTPQEKTPGFPAWLFDPNIPTDARSIGLDGTRHAFIVRARCPLAMAACCNREFVANIQICLIAGVAAKLGAEKQAARDEAELARVAAIRPTTQERLADLVCAFLSRVWRVLVGQQLSARAADAAYSGSGRETP